VIFYILKRNPVLFCAMKLDIGRRFSWWFVA